jgi:hypothetical protein
MPFKSQAQRGYMYSQHPKLAKEFEAATPKGKKLPYHIASSRAKGISKGLGGSNGRGSSY